jgi:NAD(P)-dependent dehydrogenase (short-subunit alcohol dehydrogenase family)
MTKQASQQPFAGRTAVVTGAGAGIGRATALRLLAGGARVIATDLLGERLADLANEPGDVVLLTGDITEPGTIARIAGAAQAVDILVNNAGIMDGFLPAAEVDDDTWARVMAVNATAPMRLMRALLPGMIERGKGAIVNITSEAGLRGSSAGIAYTASKHALIGMTRHAAFQYGPSGIRVNAVAPGAVRTSIEAPFKSAAAAARIGPVLQATMPGVAEPEQLAATICWLASDEASNVNGAVLACDGAWSAV